MEANTRASFVTLLIEHDTNLKVALSRLDRTLEENGIVVVGVEATTPILREEKYHRSVHKSFKMHIKQLIDNTWLSL